MSAARTPIVVGIGQVSNQDPDRIVHPATLQVDAARLALTDAGADLRPHIGAVFAAPMSVFGEERGGEMVAERLGLAPGARVQWRYSGAEPQHHLANACEQVARGDVDAVLLVGGIADASVRNAGRRGVAPPAPPTSTWSQGSGGVGGLERAESWTRPRTAEIDAGALLPSSYFALVESAIAADLGDDADTHRRRLGELLAPFTDVAATRPDLAWRPVPRTASEIATVGPDNRLVAEPYTKWMCSFPTVDLAAAVIVTSTEWATRLGIPAAKWVHPWASAGAKEPGPPSTRPDLHRSAALDAAVSRVLDLAGTTQAAIGAFDLYSCFPAAVQLAMAAFGLAYDDPRPRTLTGGLPYFGGPGANYTLHGIVAAVERSRDDPGSLTAVVGLGGSVDDFAVGLYAAAAPDRPFRRATADPVQRDVPIVHEASGLGVVEAATVLHERDRGPVAAPAIVRLPDGSRIGARAGNPGLPAAVAGHSLVGTTVHVSTTGDRTTWSLD